MTPTLLHEKLIEVCKSGSVEDIKYYLDLGADPNLNLKRHSNALYIAIENDKYEIVEILLEYGATVQEFVLQKAIEKDKKYLSLLIPDLKTIQDEKLLLGILQAAINIEDVSLVKEVIKQGAKPKSLFIYAIQDLDNIEILQVLIENGFNIHAENNKIVTQWMGASAVGGWRNSKPAKHEILSFISTYYLEKPHEIEKFSKLHDQTRLFRLGLDTNNFNMMKFALIIGADKNESLNSALYRYYAYKKGNTRNAEVDYEIIEYILNSDISFNKVTISNAVCFQYLGLLDALDDKNDLAYGYEMAYHYENKDLCEYFINRGVDKETQSFAKMRVSALKGNIKELSNAIHDGAKLEMLERDSIVKMINDNKVESLKYIYDSGVVLDSSFNDDLNMAMTQFKAYETISFLVEYGFDITNVKNIPLDFRIKYPLIADMWEKRFADIFDYTIYLATQVHPQVEGKKKEEVLGRIAELSALPYVMKKSQEKSHG